MLLLLVLKLVLMLRLRSEGSDQNVGGGIHFESPDGCLKILLRLRFQVAE